MTARAPTKPPTAKQMWRRLISRAHPDAGGDHELFTWASKLKEHVSGESIEELKYVPPRRTANAGEATDREPFEPEGFNELTYLALVTARDVPERYARLLKLLSECDEAHYGALVKAQRRGASYKRLATIGHKAGMSKAERVRWYRIAESIPLSDRHAGHILSKLERRGA